MDILLCPVCGGPLQKSEAAYRCRSGHSFDRARSGYVNLLPPTAGGKRHGDDRLMVRARTEFLNRGYYALLADAVADCAADSAPQGSVIVDVGCGEGYYTQRVWERLCAAGAAPTLVGVDISKEALIGAARRSKDWTLCAASAAHLPLADESADLLLNIFSPLEAAEFARVLKPNGRLLRVLPLEGHLWELKELIYEQPYRNPAPEEKLDGFHLLHRRDVRCTVSLRSGEDIMALFRMTPYYYKTGAHDQEKAARACALDTRAEFGLLLYEKA